MGDRFFLSWFRKPLSELYAIKETRFNELSEADQKGLLKAIEEKEKSLNEKFN